MNGEMLVSRARLCVGGQKFFSDRPHSRRARETTVQLGLLIRPGRTLGLSAWLEIQPISKRTARGTIKALQCPALDHQVRHLVNIQLRVQLEVKFVVPRLSIIAMQWLY